MTEFYDQEKEPTEEEVLSLLSAAEEITEAAAPVAELVFNAASLHSMEMLLRLGMANLILTFHDEHNCPKREVAMGLQISTLEHLITECAMDEESLINLADTVLTSIRGVWEQNPDMGEWVQDHGD